MCGIAGIISSEPGRFNNSTIKKMNQALAHRGPDGDSYWENPSRNILFGHRRLSIIDLSSNGSQAMHYKNRYTIIYNGEIYNYIELKELLSKKGYLFKTQSDTEVILAAFDCYKMACLELFDGMFSFAIWDELEQMLFAARDRFGEKPFFYYYDAADRVLWFASEIKALFAGGIETSIDNEKLLMFIGAGYTEIATDKNGTFYRNIKQLPPAAFLIYQPSEKQFHIKEYWNLNKENRISITEANAIEKFNTLFTISVARRLRSDVPLGTSLSGGLDSSAVAAKIFDQSSANCGRKSFSAIFPGFIKDESTYIEKITEAFNLEKHTTTPTAEEFIRDLPLLMHHHEGPISSASVYLQYRVFELAKQQDVKVLLDGQGADEILGGYTKYIHWHLQELLNQNKFSDFKSEQKSLRLNKIPYQWGWKNYASALLPTLSKQTLEGKEITLIKRNFDIDKDFAFQNLNRDLISKPHITKLNDILYFNTRDLGLGELLRYADRNSMAHGCEVRLPFLNHELVEFVFSLPSSFKIHDGWTKWILRKSIEKCVPHEIVWRKDKVGFEPPQKSWMENKLVQDYIYESKRNLVKRRILRPTVLNKKIQPHDAYAADNLEWRYLVAGELLK